MPEKMKPNSAVGGSSQKSGISHTLRLASSFDDVRTFNFWQSLLAELIGTFILVITSLGSTVQGWSTGATDIVQIALTFGFSVSTAVWIFGHISGGHINPAVTVGMFVTRRISLFRTIFYIIMQCLGAMSAAGLLKLFTPTAQRGELGTTFLSNGVTVGQGVGVEFCITFFLVLTVFATCDSKRTDHAGSFPLSIGIAVSMGHFWAIEFTGSSMNSARSLGPAVAMNNWDHHWVYWVGPLLGGMVAGIIYDHMFASNASFVRFRHWLTSPDYDADKYAAKTAETKVEPGNTHTLMTVENL